MTPEELDNLLAVAIRYRDAGQLADARVLLRAILRHQPRHVPAWSCLADIAVDAEERQLALAWLHELEPHTHAAPFADTQQHQPAWMRWAAIGTATVLACFLLWFIGSSMMRLSATPVASVPTASGVPFSDSDAFISVPTPILPAPPTPRVVAATRTRNPVTQADPPPFDPNEPTMPLETAVAVPVVPTAAVPMSNTIASSDTVESGPVPADDAASGPFPSIERPATVTATLVTSSPLPDSANDASPVAAATAGNPALWPAPPTPRVPVRAGSGPPQPNEVLPGTPLEADGWSATLVTPGYTQILKGTIGSFQPQGQCILALLSVGNNTDTARRIPPDFFVLIDDQGRSYRPLPDVSSAYLEVYGRGQRGDLALEDDIQPGGGMVSVPLLFDVPHDATGLVLTMTHHSEYGWTVLDRVQ
ncbi:MAG: hypothetical protein HC837_17950 [Chloroflexaceae bacterium]|nr:hypothetical protein [Chloroflexaceae bacterium]